jgi:hypothetical protein
MVHFTRTPLPGHFLRLRVIGRLYEIQKRVEPMNTKYLLAGLCFVLIFLSGFWLSRSGKPYSTLIITLHKLIGLATGVFLVRTVMQARQAAPLGPLGTGAILVSVVLFAGLVATGGLLSAQKVMPPVVNLVHRVLPYLTGLSSAATLYLLIA